MAEKKISTIPEIPPGVDPKLHRILAAVKEALEVRLGRRGDPLEEAITKRDLLDAGIAKRLGSGLARADVTEDQIVKTPPKGALPPAPVAFMAEGVFGGVVLSWQHPLEYYDEHSLAEIWRSTSPDPTTRELIATAPGSMYFDQIASPEQLDYYYWIRFASSAGRFGPFSDVVKATKPEDVGQLLDRLSGEIDETILAQALRERIDLIDGTDPGSVSARIADERTERTTADTALAQSIQTVQTAVNGNTASIQSQATVLNGLSAQYVVKSDVNGYVTGFGFYNSGGFGDFQVHADRFSVGKPGVAGRKPFIIDGNQVVIDTAVIRDGSIQQGKIGPISFGKITDASGNPVTTVGGRLKAQYIEGDSIVTNYFSANSAFVRTAHIENAAITNAKIGDAAITRAKIGDLAVDTLKIAGNAVTIPLFTQGGWISRLYFNSPIECCSVSGYFDVSTFVQFTGQLFINNNGEGGHVEIDVRYNGNIVGSRRFFAMWGVNSAHSFFGGVHVPAGGGRFSLHARLVEWDASWLVVAGSALSVMGVKR